MKDSWQGTQIGHFSEFDTFTLFLTVSFKQFFVARKYSIILEDKTTLRYNRD